jgi:hypothetical protein
VVPVLESTGERWKSYLEEARHRFAVPELAEPAKKTVNSYRSMFEGPLES